MNPTQEINGIVFPPNLFNDPGPEFSNISNKQSSVLPSPQLAALSQHTVSTVSTDAAARDWKNINADLQKNGEAILHLRYLISNEGNQYNKQCSKNFNVFQKETQEAQDIIEGFKKGTVNELQIHQYKAARMLNEIIQVNLNMTQRVNENNDNVNELLTKGSRLIEEAETFSKNPGDKNGKQLVQGKSAE